MNLLKEIAWGSAIGRIVSVVLLALGAWYANNAYQRHAGAKQVIAESKADGKVKNAKAQTAHRNAARPGASERVLKYCRDCN